MGRHKEVEWTARVTPMGWRCFPVSGSETAMQKMVFAPGADWRKSAR
jgi:hypothetical protein